MHKNLSSPKAEMDENIQTMEKLAIGVQKAIEEISMQLVTEKNPDLPQASCLPHSHGVPWAATPVVQMDVSVRSLTSCWSLAGTCEGLASSSLRGSNTVTSANSSTDS